MSHAALAHAVNGFFDSFRSKSSLPHVAAQPASRASRARVESRYNEGDDESLLESATSLPRPTLKALEKSIRADGFKGALVSGWSQGQRGGFTVHYDGQEYEFEISENVTPRPAGELGRLVKESGRYGQNGRRSGILPDGSRATAYYDDDGDTWSIELSGVDGTEVIAMGSDPSRGIYEDVQEITGQQVPWDHVPPVIKRHVEQRVVSAPMVANARHKGVTVDDLPVSPRGQVLACPRCHAEYSAARGDYFTMPKGEVLACSSCEVPFVLTDGLRSNARRIPEYLQPYQDFTNDEFYRELLDKGYTPTQARLQAKVASHAVGKVDYMPPRNIPKGWVLSSQPIFRKRDGLVAFEAHKGSRYMVFDQAGVPISPELRAIRGLLEWRGNDWIDARTG